MVCPKCGEYTTSNIRCSECETKYIQITQQPIPSELIGLLEAECLENLPVCEVTDLQREQAQKSELHKRGDMVLVWVNAGDLMMAGVRRF